MVAGEAKATGWERRWGAVTCRRSHLGPAREPLTLPLTPRTATEATRSRHSQRRKPVNPLAGWCFQTQTWPLLIKMATGKLRRRFVHDAAAARQWRHLCCDRAGCWPSAGDPAVSGAAQWSTFRSPPLPSLGCPASSGGDHQVRLGAEQSEDDVGCLYDRQSGFESSDTGSGPSSSTPAAISSRSACCMRHSAPRGR
jgi:hypothetical protein